MADSATAHGGHGGGDAGAHGADMDFHTDTYGSVMALLKWGTVGCAIIAAIVVWLIA